MNRSLHMAASAAVILGLGLSAAGMFMNRSVKVPVDRAVANVQKWIQEKPQDAQAYYVLGRLHAMAWAFGPELNLWRPMPEGGERAADAANAAPGADPFNGKLPGFGPYDAVQVRRDEKKSSLTETDATHLREAIANYRKAVELDPKSGIYELGLAWLLQEAGKIARQLPSAVVEMPEAKSTEAEKAVYATAIGKLADVDPTVREEATRTLATAMPKPLEQLRAVKSGDAELLARVDSLLKGYFDLLALEHYRKAYSAAVQADLAKPGGLIQANSVVSAEAGEAILQILTTHPGASKPNEEKEIGTAIKTLNEKPRAITPVIFAMPAAGGSEMISALPASASITDLLDPLGRSTFDLAGDDVHREWPWVKPTTAFLVWDPENTGQITSGRALFGSATWWIAFRDGYEALSILDDNRDGQLTGAELQGIAVWVDKNTNGVSERGEVEPLAEAGILSLGLRPRTAPDGTLTIDKGIAFGDGAVVPSFDWVTAPARVQSASSR